MHKIEKEKFKITKIPRFDKSIDDRLPKCKWQKITKKPDIIIFSCVRQHIKSKRFINTNK